MVIDLFRCIGCHACTYACKAENVTGPGVFWTWVYDYERGKYPNVIRSFLPILCMHCENPPCERVCPSGATYRREDGIVAIDPNKCVSCKACMVACPYHVRFQNPENRYFVTRGHQRQEHHARRQQGIVEKCNFCTDRIERGVAHDLTPGMAWDANPACVNACPVNARTFGNLDDTDSDIMKLITSQKGDVLDEELGTSPSVFYISIDRSLATKIRTGSKCHSDTGGTGN